MDLKVSVEGVLREVGGVVDSTSCEEIIFKLAQEEGLQGFLTLVAKLRGAETTLSPDEKILRFIRKYVYWTVFTFLFILYRNSFRKRFGDRG